MADVLILLAAYNGAEYLRQQLDSILAQDHADWHLVLSDDGSSDETPEILAAYAAAQPEKITLYRSGCRFGNAQNHFLHLLSRFHDAAYILFCDQDDVWHRDKIRKTMEKMRSIETAPTVPALVHTDLRVVDGALRPLDDSFLRYSGLDGRILSLNRLLIQNVVTGCAMMINRALAQILCEKLPEKDVMMHDWFLAVLASACGTVGFLNEATIDYRQHGANTVGAKNSRSLAYLKSRLSQRLIRDSVFSGAAQAALILRHYSRHIPEENRKILAAYASLPRKNWFSRRYTYLKYGFYKHGFARCVALFLFG